MDGFVCRGTVEMDLCEIVRCDENLLFDLSLEFMRCRGRSRLDAGVNFLFKYSDQLVPSGPDSPKSSPQATLVRFSDSVDGEEPHRIEGVTWRILERRGLRNMSACVGD